ncbi:hypothetical protein, partial [Nocardioides sp.]|uniref:hypothetical protein n=1 Tax=Nocardioides sp. TaxID=35761 RepID=UPI0035641883
MGILGNSTIGFGTTSRVRSTGPVCVALALMASALTAVTLGITAAPASAVTTNSLSIAVSAARTEPRALGGAGVTKGDPITEFQWLINVDNTGTTAQRSAEPGTGCSTADPGYPGSCDWP